MEGNEDFFTCVEKEPRDRGVADVDIICLRLKELIAFQKFKPHHLSNFASVMVVERVEADQTLFKQGDEGSEWYVIFEGSVDINVGGQVVCSFGAGIGFGDVAIVENRTRTATVITKEKSVLLKIPGSIFKTVKKEIENEANTPLDELAEVSETAEAESTESVPRATEETAEKVTDDDNMSVYDFRLRGDTIKDLKMVLDIKPEERAQDDLLDLQDEISHIKAFSHLGTSVLRELSSCITAQYSQPGDILFKQGEEGTCWYIIYKGKVEVLVNGNAVCVLSDGDGFGELALINDKPRSATIRAIDICQFIKVEKADYNRILKDIESNTIRLEEHGKEVVILEKRIDAGTKATGYVVMAGTSDRLVRQLEENNEADGSYPLDFLMCFRIFMTPQDLLKILLSRVETTQDDGDAQDKALQSKMMRQKKIAAVLKFWIINHTQDFLSEPSLVTSVLEIVDVLQKDGLESEKAKILAAMELKKLDTQGRKGAAEATPAPQQNPLANEEQGKVTLRKKGSVRNVIKGFRFSIRTMSKDNFDLSQQVEPASPTVASVKDLMKVFMVDESYKTIEIGPFTSGKDVLESALSKFANPAAGNTLDPAAFELCELKSDGGVRVIEAEEVSLVSRISLNGRLFARKKGTEDKIASPPELGAAESPFLDMETNELARLSTLHDHQLFARIDPLEFINHIYKIKGKDTTNLNNFVNQFNKMNYWVVTEICSQPKLEKRVLQIKKFIKLAVLYKVQNNYNSLFAILSGLSNIAVSRMQNTWRKVPSKLVAEYDELSKLMDPSRNMKTYRTHLLNATPPLVPFFPIVIKDLFFIHECNPSKTASGLINFDKLRLLSSIIRFIDTFRYIPYDPNVQPTFDPRKRRSTLEMLNEAHLEKAHEVHQIKEFIANLQVIDNMRVLSKLSREAESPVGRSKRSASIPKIIMGL